MIFWIFNVKTFFYGVFEWGFFGEKKWISMGFSDEFHSMNLTWQQSIQNAILRNINPDYVNFKPCYLSYHFQKRTYSPFFTIALSHVLLKMAHEKYKSAQRLTTLNIQITIFTRIACSYASHVQSMLKCMF